MPEPEMSLEMARAAKAALMADYPTVAPLRGMIYLLEDQGRIRYRRSADREPSRGGRQQPNDADFVWLYKLECNHSVYRTKIAGRTRCGYCLTIDQTAWDNAHYPEVNRFQRIIDEWEQQAAELEEQEDAEARALAEHMGDRLTVLLARLGLPEGCLDWDVRNDGRLEWRVDATLSTDECAALILRLEALPDWVDARDDDNHERTTTDAGT